MDDAASTPAQTQPISFPYFRSTGIKMFIILTLALLPLGLVALVASLQAMRTADAERRAVLQMEALQTVRTLTSRIASDQVALQLSANTLGEDITFQCTRLGALMKMHSSSDTRFVISDEDGNEVCATGRRIPNFKAASGSALPSLELLPEQKVLLARVPYRQEKLVALTFYGQSRLAQIARSAATTNGHEIVLSQGAKRLYLNPERRAVPGTIIEQVSTTLDRSDIILTLIAHQPPKTLARMLLIFLPVLMWIAAAGIGWFVVNRLLIKPLVLLRGTVATYQPGVPLKPFEQLRTPAYEIADLGNTFRAISEDVAKHEAEMTESLARQRKLTREVHHRVKNNLQIISSLINLHSRSAATPEATEAYGSIQRRVDALSVVHRNHYAEMEENRGIGIRPLISELSASLRATVPVTGGRLNIQIDSADLRVSQDVAVPVAFLTTELVELAMLCDPHTTIRISIQPVEDHEHRALLRVASAALRTTPELQDRLEGRFDRVLIGLSRQLRAPMDRNEEEGVFCIEIPVLD